MFGLVAGDLKGDGRLIGAGQGMESETTFTFESAGCDHTTICSDPITGLSQS